MTNKRFMAVMCVLCAVFFTVTGIFVGNLASERLLLQQGYDGNFSLLGAADYVIIIGAAVVFSALFTAVIFLYRRRTRENTRRRVADLTAYLRQMNEGHYILRPEIKEDELSPLEDELYKTILLLREGRRNAQMEKERLAQNLSDIAHQLKTPLSAIALMSDLLSAEASGQSAEYIARITAQVERLNTLVSALLALSRLDAGTLALERKPVDVMEMLASVREALLPLLASKAQKLLLPHGDAVYNGDFYWSAQAFLNILKNCCEHTPRGGEVILRWEENPVCTVITAEDNGEGIPPEDLPHLFTRFYRGRNAAKDSVGIGLSLAKALIMGQNGELTAQNKPEGGALFTVKFYS